MTTLSGSGCFAQNFTLSRPVGATYYVLEAVTSLPVVSWDVVTNTLTVTTNERSVQLLITGGHVLSTQETVTKPTGMSALLNAGFPTGQSPTRKSALR